MQAGFCSGRLLRRALFAVALVASTAEAQTPPKPAAKQARAKRANEVTLAGLRPGRDNIAKARQLYGVRDAGSSKAYSAEVWEFTYAPSTFIYLIVTADKQETIQTVRVLQDHPDGIGYPLKYSKIPSRRLASGLGAAVGDSCFAVEKLFGEPDSRSPSTRDHQPLELLHYAFDWAGEDVPQVMQVLCSKNPDGIHSQVEEITLAAPGL